jgi:hypothetical protein
LELTSNKIAAAIKDLACVTEAISVWLLFAGGRKNSVMPTAQFNQFERLDKPIMQAGSEEEAQTLWDRLTDERDRYLEEVDDALIARTNLVADKK